MIKLYKLINRKVQESRTGEKPKPKPKPTCKHQQKPLAPVHVDESEVPLNTLQTGSSNGQDPRSSTTPEQDDGKCQICRAEKRAARIYRWKLIGGLVLPDLLSSLDLTIVATATPFIASHFDKFDQLNWIVTSFTLTSTAFIPAFGQLSDVFGRHAVLQLAMFLMLVGSVLCAAAQTWGMLLLGRALQGTSSAGITNIVRIILADKVSLKDNSKNNSIFAFISGIGYAIGPEIGGYLTDSNWRYCFLIPIPLAFISHILIYVLLRKELMSGTHFKKGSRLSSFFPALATLDIFGTIFFIFGVGLMILGTAWAGSTYAWSSPQVVAPIAVGGVCLVLFFVYEYLLEPGRIFARIFPKQSPMLPYRLFQKKDMLWLAILQFAAGAAMYSVFYFIGIYFTLVEAYPASKAGIQLLYYIPGIGVGVYTAVYLCNVKPAQTFLPLTLGTFAETLGLALITWGVSVQNTGVLNGMMVVAGAGTGIRFMPCTLHVSGIWAEKIAPAMSVMRFALPFGGTLGLTIMGSVFNNKLAGSPALSSAGGAGGIGGQGGFDAHDTQSLTTLANLPDAVQDKVRMAGKDAVMWAFISIMPIMGISLVTGLFLGNVWIKKKGPKDDEEKREPEEEEDAGSSQVIYVPYLWALLKGNVNSYKHTTRPLSDGERQERALAEMETRTGAK